MTHIRLGLQVLSICILSVIVCSSEIGCRHAYIILNESTNGATYRLTSQGLVWLDSTRSGIQAYVYGKWRSSAAGSMNPARQPAWTNGSDANGHYVQRTFYWGVQNSSTTLELSFRAYEWPLCALLLSQSWKTPQVGVVNGTNSLPPCTKPGASCPAEPSVEFPSFSVHSSSSVTQQLGYLTWYGNYITQHAAGRGLSQIPVATQSESAGYETGPVVLHDGSGIGASIVVGPLTHPLVAVQSIGPSQATGASKSKSYYYTDETAGESSLWRHGISGEVPRLFATPSSDNVAGKHQKGQFFHATAIVPSLDGVRAATRAYGQMLLRAAGAGNKGPDPAAQYLSAWTDHGSSYYFFYWENPLSDGPPADVVLDWWQELGEGGAAAISKRRTAAAALADAPNYSSSSSPPSSFSSSSPSSESATQTSGSTTLRGPRSPFRYMQLDAWWYATDGFNACIQDFSGHPKYFPDGGVGAFSKRLQAWGLFENRSVHLYHNYFCPNNSYTSKYGFFESDDPQKEYLLVRGNESRAFYDALWAQGIEQGMLGTEIDYLSTSYQLQPALRESLTNAQDWLQGMADAALHAGVPLQTCMMLPRYLLATAHFPAVADARGSQDFWQDPVQYEYRSTGNLVPIGYSALLLDALGLRVSKDTLWTSWPQPMLGGMNQTHPNPHIHVPVAVLSRGPVGVSDVKGHTDFGLLLGCCADDGRILQPTRAIASSPRTFAQPKFPATDPLAGVAGSLVWSSSADVPPQSRHGSNDSSKLKKEPAFDEAADAAATGVLRSHQVLGFNVTSGPWELDGTRNPDGWPLSRHDLFPVPDVSVPLVWRAWYPQGQARGAALPAASSTAACVEGAVIAITHGGRAGGESCAFLWPAGVDTGPTISTGTANRTTGRMDDVLVHVHEATEGWVLLGELDKFVPASPDRVTGYSITASGCGTTTGASLRAGADKVLRVTVLGSEGEVVRMVAAAAGSDGAWTVRVRQVTLPGSGTAEICFE